MIAGVIFARGGSKGVPRKNIRLLNNKPLIAYAIETALASSYIDYLFVSTDDAEIAEVARSYGADVPFMRPAELASDTSPEILSWKHAIETIRQKRPDFDLMVSVPTTAPLRLTDDIDACIEMMLADDAADMIITVSKAEHSPYFNMVTLDEESNANIVIPMDITRRQDAPTVYDIATVAYVARCDYILETDNLFKGNVKAVEIPRIRALDIDTELDFTTAEILMNEINGN